MDTREFGRKLKKISLLFDTVSENGEISSLEKDLLMSYIRDLYEVAGDFAVASIKKSEGYNEKKSEIKISENVPHSPVISEERPVIDLSDSLPAAKITPKEEPAVQEKKPVITAEADVKKESVVPKIELKQTDAQAVAELFQEAKVSDLSDKLAQTQIKDLTKAMGINEKIFTVQELFGGNTEHFNKVMQDLNNLTDYDAAKNYMIEEVIPKYNWTSDNKIKKAVTFVRMIRRRFV